MSSGKYFSGRIPVGTSPTSQMFHIGTQIEKSGGIEDPNWTLVSISVGGNGDRLHSEISERAGAAPKPEEHVPAVENASGGYYNLVYSLDEVPTHIIHWVRSSSECCISSAKINECSWHPKPSLCQSLGGHARRQSKCQLWIIIYYCRVFWDRLPMGAANVFHDDGFRVNSPFSVAYWLHPRSVDPKYNVPFQWHISFSFWFVMLFVPYYHTTQQSLVTHHEPHDHTYFITSFVS